MRKTEFLSLLFCPVIAKEGTSGIYPFISQETSRGL